MSRTQIANMVDGVANEFSKTLELVGVGYRAQMKGTALNLALGYSHDIDYPAPEGVKIATPKPTEIVICPASTNKRSDRLLRKSAHSVRLNRTKARA